MQGIFRKENTDKALKYGIYRHLPTYEKIIRNLVSFYRKKNPRRTDKEWLDLIQECRSSGLSDKCWCQEHHIHTSNFYYQIRRLRQKACEIPEPVHSSFSGKQEVVPLSFEEPAVCPSSVQLKTDTIPDSVIKITYHSFQIEITNAADRETIFHMLSALQDLC